MRGLTVVPVPILSVIAVRENVWEVFAFHISSVNQSFTVGCHIDNSFILVVCVFQSDSGE